VEEFNSTSVEDVHRIYSIYVESDLQVLTSSMSLLHLYFLPFLYFETDESSLLLGRYLVLNQ
jgi:hypothetical protein